MDTDPYQVITITTACRGLHALLCSSPHAATIVHQKGREKSGVNTEKEV